jgi:integrating conjugative element protein (TIGR03759 family)
MLFSYRRSNLIALLLTFTVSANTKESLTIESNVVENQSMARVWGLSDEEWTHYGQLKKTERGIWSPSLDPLTTLGIEASNDTERRYYAELLVKKEYQRVEKELAFQLAYDAAWQRLFPKISPIKIEEENFLTENAKGRFALFVTENCSICEKKLKTLLDQGKLLDIYLVGSQNDDSRLRQWAISNQIDTNRVKNREITLNHDAGRWKQIGKGHLPVALEKRGSEWLIVALP